MHAKGLERTMQGTTNRRSSYGQRCVALPRCAQPNFGHRTSLMDFRMFFQLRFTLDS